MNINDEWTTRNLAVETVEWTSNEKQFIWKEVELRPIFEGKGKVIPLELLNFLLIGLG